MARYVFVNASGLNDQALAAAVKPARSRGATVVKSLAGTMLLEVTPAQGLGGLALCGRKARGALAAAAKG